MCNHENFKSEVSINRSILIEENSNIPIRYFLKLNVVCSDCGKKFHIQGKVFGINNMEIIPVDYD